MTATEEDFLELNRRLQAGRERLAVLTAREEEKKKEREALLKELKKAGVNTDDLDGEIRRLEDAIQADYDKAETLVTEFETKLDEGARSSAVELAAHNGAVPGSNPGAPTTVTEELIKTGNAVPKVEIPVADDDLEI